MSLSPASLVSIDGGHPRPDLCLLGGIVKESVLPKLEEDDVCLVPGGEGGEEVLVCPCADLDRVRDDESSLLLGHGCHLELKNIRSDQ